MLANKNQAIVSGLLGLGIAGFATATALPFNDRIEYRIGNRIESQPAWLVPLKAEFRSIERGFGGIKILLSLLATGGMVTVMLIARKEAEQEPIRQRIKKYQNQAYEFDYAAESAFQMASTQQRYKKLLEADEVAIEGEIEQAYLESMGITQQQQPQLTGTTTLDSVANPGDKVQQSTSPAIGPNPNLEISRQIANKILNSLAGINTSIFLAAPTRCGKTHTLHKWLADLTTRFPQADIYVISQKYEDFPGVASDRLTVFDPLQIEKSMQFLDEVYDKLQQRKSKPATEETYRNRPIKLILEDWFATHQCLSQKRNSVIWESVAAKLGMIATVGGQYNVGYFICTQSFNIASSGVADSNIRLNLALLAQGLVRTTSNDEEQGSYGVIEQMLNNSNVIASKDTRDNLAANLKLLIPTSMDEQTPIILSTIGNPVLGLMPKIEINKLPLDEVSSAEVDSSAGSVGTGRDVPSQNVGSPAKPYRKGAEASEASEASDCAEASEGSLEDFLADVLTEASAPVFSEEFPLKDHQQRVQLAKLIIAENLGKEKTIFLLWGVTSGGRSHQRYADARAMLEKLMKGEQNNG
ncbi:hypothetical protein QUA56_33580 [Microcoleus sp. N3A4]|uniref:hypothetical protein n=1 Tax=Microcoleus sp. N3A4 TaxID=3055379 RepID=UPI002FD1BA81